MVKNWQSRVELNDARRQQAKQRKQKSEDKRLYKNKAVELLGLLDRHSDSLRKFKGRDGSHRRILHIWTDTLAADSPEGPTSGKQRKPRSGSVESDGSDTGRKGRGRSDSITEKGSKKKVHPRSHKEAAALDTPENGSQSDDPVLCKPHFFAGKCKKQGQKGGGCRHMHYTTPHHKTLYAICCGDKNDQKESARDQVSRAEEAVAPEEDPGAMEMVHYFSHVLVNSNDKKEEEEEAEKESAISDALNEALAGKKLAIASIVYAALDGVLVYDRYRDGVILSDQDFMVTAVGGKAAGLRRTSEGDGPDLPGQVLEYILTFLPDSAVSVASQVCKPWHYEIGRNSPNLWRHMLERRGWPLPNIDLDLEPTTAPMKEADNATQRLFREAFLRHYAVIRDVSAIKNGLTMKRGGVGKKEMSYQEFSTRKYAPAALNACVSVQVWGPNRILAAYADDCSLRLFATVPKVGSDESLCRELVCQRIDPYRNTKKRSCQIISVGLDEDVVGSLCHVMADGVVADAYVLIILTRDDFLLGESNGAGDSEDANLRVIDIGEAVIHYLLNRDENLFDEVDHRLSRLVDFIDDGGDIGDVEVLVSPTMAACGRGRFMVEVSLSMPTLDLDDEGNEGSTLQLLDRKLVLFSASIGAIVWMGESQPLTRELRPRHEDMTLTYTRRPHPGGSRASCSIIVASATSPVIMVGEIEPSGHVQSAQLLDGSELVRSEILEEGWEMNTSHSRPVLVTSSDVIAADTMYREVENRGNEFRSVVSFYPRYKGADDALYSILPISGNMEVIRMSSFRDEHVVAICRETTLSTNNLVDVEDLGEQLFAVNLEAEENKSVHAVIIHVPSRREIGRVKLMDDVSNSIVDVPRITVTSENTVGVGVSWRGIIMTGSDVRYLAERSDTIVLDDTLTPAKAAKGKALRRKKEGGKKISSRQKKCHK
jgi:hypothetical protein